MEPGTMESTYIPSDKNIYKIYIYENGKMGPV